MSKRYITLGDGKHVSLAAYVAAVKHAIQHPEQRYARSLNERWPATGAEIRREYRRSMHDRISQAIPYSQRGM